jgi:hypothetical protein
LRGFYTALSFLDLVAAAVGWLVTAGLKNIGDESVVD